MAEEVKVEKSKIKEAKTIEVPTQMGTMIELEDGSRVDDIQLLVKIYNKLLKIEKSVA